MSPDTSWGDDLDAAQREVLDHRPAVLDKCIEQMDDYSQTSCSDTLEGALAANKQLSSLLQEPRYDNLQDEYSQACATTLATEQVAYQEWRDYLGDGTAIQDDAAIDVLSVSDSSRTCGWALTINVEGDSVFDIVKSLATDPLLLWIGGISMAWWLLAAAFDYWVLRKSDSNKLPPVQQPVLVHSKESAMAHGAEQRPAGAGPSMGDRFDSWEDAYAEWLACLRPWHRRLYIVMRGAIPLIIGYYVNSALDIVSISF